MAEKLSVILCPREQNAGKSHNVRIGNKCFENVANFRQGGGGKHRKIKITGSKKLRADLGMAATVWSRIVCLPICYFISRALD